MLDLAPLDGSDPAANHAVIEHELAAHDPRLAALPRVLALSKADLVEPEAAERAVREWHARMNPGIEAERDEWDEPVDVPPVLVTSSATGHGLDELARELLRRVPVEAPPPAARRGLAEYRVFRPAAGANLRRREAGGAASSASPANRSSA